MAAASKADAATALAAGDLKSAAEGAGCRVVSATTMTDGARTWPVLTLECGDNAGAIRFLNRAAELDAGDPTVRDLALRLHAAHPNDFAPAVQAFVQRSVRFLREARETFQHALYTLSHAGGDCDDHARTVVALLRAVGERAQIVGVPNSRGQIVHVAPIVWDGKGWKWVETTVRAAFGEHPRAAAKRLGLLGTRTDLNDWHTRRKGAPDATHV